MEGPTGQITTVENEFPFLAYVEEAGGPTGLGDRDEIAVYVAGFPAPVLIDTLAAIAARKPGLRFQHWGDADSAASASGGSCGRGSVGR